MLDPSIKLSEYTGLPAGEELFQALAGPRCEEGRRAKLLSVLPEDTLELHVQWLSSQLWSSYVSLRHVPPLVITKEQYGSFYRYYAQVMAILGPDAMKVRVWDQLGRADLRHWKWFTDVRRARYKQRYRNSDKGRAAIKEAQRKYNASPAGKKRRKRYRQAQSKGFIGGTP